MVLFATTQILIHNNYYIVNRINAKKYEVIKNEYNCLSKRF